MNVYSRHADMPEDEYHARPELGSTQIRAALKSRDHFELASQPVEPSSAMILGSAIHCAVLEPERWQSEYIDARPPVDTGDMYYRHVDTAKGLAKGLSVDLIAEGVGVKEGTVEGYAEREDVQALADHYAAHPPGLTPDMSDADIAKAERIRDAVLAHPEAGAMLDNGIGELSIFGKNCGVEIKGRIDWLADISGDPVLVDLKTTRQCVESSAFARTIAKRDLHVQAGLYSMIYHQVHDRWPAAFRWIAVETCEPYSVELIECGPETLDEGCRLVDIACDRIKRWRTEPGTYGGYSSTNQVVEMPGWAFRSHLIDSDEITPAPEDLPF